MCREIFIDFHILPLRYTLHVAPDGHSPLCRSSLQHIFWTQDKDCPKWHTSVGRCGRTRCRTHLDHMNLFWKWELYNAVSQFNQEYRKHSPGVVGEAPFWSCAKTMLIVTAAITMRADKNFILLTTQFDWIIALTLMGVFAVDITMRHFQQKYSVMNAFHYNRWNEMFN